MQRAYFITGLGVIIVALGAWIAFNRTFSGPVDTEANLVTSSSTTRMTGNMALSSAAFAESGSLPAKYTCDADVAVSPPLAIAGVPSDAKSLALIVHDPDVPKQLLPSGVFDHWVLFNIAPSTTAIAEGVGAGTPGQNGAGKNEYAAPCPPKQYEPSEHRYIFMLYALDTELALKAGASKADVLQAMEGHVIEQAQLIGKYKKK